MRVLKDAKQVGGNEKKATSFSLRLLKSGAQEGVESKVVSDIETNDKDESDLICIECSVNWFDACAQVTDLRTELQSGLLPRHHHPCRDAERRRWV